MCLAVFEARVPSWFGIAHRPAPLWSRTLMPAPLLYPAGPYHTLRHLKSVYLCTLRSSVRTVPISWRSRPPLFEGAGAASFYLVALHRFLSRPRRSLPETVLSSLPVCPVGRGGLMRRAKQIGRLQHIFSATPAECGADAVRGQD